jgi:tRNA-guanine family transglycosylase
MFTFETELPRMGAHVQAFFTLPTEISQPDLCAGGTQATVKSLTPAQLHELGASLVLSNTYHLYLPLAPT